jgi:hypothetical protein
VAFADPGGEIGVLIRSMRDRIDVRASLQFRERKISSMRRRVALEKSDLELVTQVSAMAEMLTPYSPVLKITGCRSSCIRRSNVYLASAQRVDYWRFGVGEAGVAGEDAAAWDTTIKSNDFPSTLNFILFLSSLNSIAVFIGMMACSEGFG